MHQLYLSTYHGTAKGNNLSVSKPPNACNWHVCVSKAPARVLPFPPSLCKRVPTLLIMFLTMGILCETTLSVFVHVVVKLADQGKTVLLEEQHRVAMQVKC